MANRQGSGFVNLQQYLDANKNNNLEGTVASGINNEADQTKQGLNKAQDEFDTQSQAGRLDSDANKQESSRILGEAQNATKDSDVSDQDYTKFNSLKSGEYAGPNSLKNTDQLHGQAQAASQAGEAAGSESGRYGLLQRYLGGNQGYSYGQQKLDNALLGSSNGNQLRQASRNVAGLDQSVTAANANAGNQALGLQNQAKQFKSDLMIRLGADPTSGQFNLGTDADGKLTGQGNGLIQNSYNNVLSNYSKNLNDFNTNKALKTAADAGTMTPEQASRLGLTQGQQIWGLNPSDYINVDGANGPTRNNTATQGDYAKINALSKLAGINNTLITSPGSAAYDPDKAFSINKSGLDQELRNKQGQYDLDLKNTMSDVPTYSNGYFNPLGDLGNWTTDHSQQSVTDAIAAIQNQINNPTLSIAPYGRNAQEPGTTNYRATDTTTSMTPQIMDELKAALQAATAKQSEIQSKDRFYDRLSGQPTAPGTFGPSGLKRIRGR